MRNIWDNTHQWILFVRAYFGCHMETRGAAFQCHLHFQGSVNRPSPELVWFVSRQRECKEESKEGKGALWMEGGTNSSLSPIRGLPNLPSD